jgi:hypothetical protein
VSCISDGDGTHQIKERRGWDRYGDGEWYLHGRTDYTPCGLSRGGEPPLDAGGEWWRRWEEEDSRLTKVCSEFELYSHATRDPMNCNVRI